VFVSFPLGRATIQDKLAGEKQALRGGRFPQVA